MAILRAFRVLALLALLPRAWAAAPEPAPAAISAAAPATVRADFTVATRKVFVFRATLAGHSLQDRLVAARRRLDKASSGKGPQRATARQLADGSQVLLDGAPPFLVTPADINVVDMGMFETSLRTGSGEEVLMPNAWVLSNTTSNFSRDGVVDDGFVTEVRVTLAYETPWRTVHALLEQAAATPGIAAEPKPFIVQSALSDFYVEYRLCAHSSADTQRGRAEARNGLHQNVLDVFDGAGVGLTSSHFHCITLTERRA